MKVDYNIYNKAKLFSSYFRDVIRDKIPAKDRDVRIHLDDEVYNLIRYIYEAYYTDGKVRIKAITEAIISISMIDYLFGIITDIDGMDSKKVNHGIAKLTDVKNLLYAWKKNCEAK